MAAIGDRQVLDVQTKSTTVGPRASSSAASATFSCVDMFWLRATCAAIPAVVQQNAPRASSAKRGWRDLTATAQAVRTLTESPPAQRGPAAAEAARGATRDCPPSRCRRVVGARNGCSYSRYV